MCSNVYVCKINKSVVHLIVYVEVGLYMLSVELQWCQWSQLVILLVFIIELPRHCLRWTTDTDRYDPIQLHRQTHAETDLCTILPERNNLRTFLAHK